MIILSPNIQGIVATGASDYFYLVDIKHENGTVWKRVTSHNHNINLSDGRVFLADGTLAKVDPPKITTSVGKDEYTVIFVDSFFAEGAPIDAGIINYKVEIRMGFLNALGEPFLNIVDTLLVYGGKVSETNYMIRTEAQGEVALQIKCASPMADLDLKKCLYFSKDAVRSRNPIDSCADDVYSGSSIIALKWGKA